jgi:hypothetical protein
MPKKLYEPVDKKGRELLWMDWQQSQDRSVCRGDPKLEWRINPAARLVRPFDRKVAHLILEKLSPRKKTSRKKTAKRKTTKKKTTKKKVVKRKTARKRAAKR